MRWRRWAGGLVLLFFDEIRLPITPEPEDDPKRDEA